jgi:hypothetical protein
MNLWKILSSLFRSPAYQVLVEEKTKLPVDSDDTWKTIDGFGTKYWHTNGIDKPHRIDGPAIIKKDGSKYWYRDGNLHREDGPAIITPCFMEWWINGKYISSEVASNCPFQVILTQPITYANGCQMWFKDEKLHKIEFPAVITSDGWKFWFENGFKHREHGPAVRSPDGYEEWWTKGELDYVRKPDGSRWKNGKQIEIQS